MIGYVTLGTNDLERAASFYDDLLGELGAKQGFGNERIKFWSAGPGKPMIAVCIPYDQQPQHHGNGNMVAIPGGSPEGVDKLYAKARELGASDEGEPGERIPGMFYGAYVRDLDGNKICFFHMQT
ncbi:MAG: VOC family protein [Thermoanaerobaculia bacterium]|nr:VOC family protein [Thermoanaerobaculia bacterium]